MMPISRISLALVVTVVAQGCLSLAVPTNNVVKNEVKSGCGALPLPADDNRTRYFGRVDHTVPAAPQFAWVMTGAGCSFQTNSDGITVYAQFISSNDGARVRVHVDGAFYNYTSITSSNAVALPANSPTKLQEGMDAYTLVENLGPGNHTVEFFKVSEDNAQKNSKGVMTFGGFEVAMNEGGFVPHPPPQTRRLEFIGDSDTAGWCADGSPSSNDKPDKVEDASQTWAQQIARNVSADVMVEAISGYGVTKSSTPIQGLLDNTLGFDSQYKWDYGLWTPDAVLILIGPNDEMKLSGLSGSKNFISAYVELLNMVATNYKSAVVPPKIVNVCGGSLNGLDPCDDIQTAIKQFNGNGQSKVKAYYTSIAQNNWKMINGHENNEKKGKTIYNGCDGHYNVKGHGVLAGDIIPQFKQIMGW